MEEGIDEVGEEEEEVDGREEVEEGAEERLEEIKEADGRDKEEDGAEQGREEAEGGEEVEVEVEEEEVDGFDTLLTHSYVLPLLLPREFTLNSFKEASM